MRYILDLEKAQSATYKQSDPQGAGNVARFVSSKKIEEGGKIKNRYTYNGSFYSSWDKIPPGEDSFEIKNRKTESAIHVSSVATDHVTRITGILRNKDGEVTARISKEINSGRGYFYGYRAWDPNKDRIVNAVVEELKKYDKPTNNMRDMEREVQDRGLPQMEPIARDLRRMDKSLSVLNAIRDMNTFLNFANVTDRTRRQMVRRAKGLFDNLADNDKLKAVKYIVDIMKYDHP